MVADPGQSVEGWVRDAQDALRKGNAAAALSMLERAARVAPSNPQIPLNRAMVHRAMGDLTAALRDLDAVLALDPYHFLALLSKGALLEQQGLTRRAAVVYKDALTIAPGDDQLPQSLAAPVARARAAVAENNRALREHLEERLR